MSGYQGYATPERITSNYRVRPLVSWDELPERDRADFSYVEDNEWDRDTARFFRFRGSWWDSHEFQVAPDSYRARGWDGVMATSYFAAVLLRYFDRDGYELEGVVVGRATW